MLFPGNDIFFTDSIELENVRKPYMPITEKLTKRIKAKTY